VESSPNEGEGEEQRGGDGLRGGGNVGGQSLFIVHVVTLHCLHATWTLESSLNKVEGEGEEQRDGDGLRNGVNAGSRSLSTIHIAGER
jgi:hypothetical protein